MTEQEFDNLLREVLDGDRSEETLGRLGEGMKGSAERIEKYLDLMEMDSLLSCRFNLPGVEIGNEGRVYEFSDKGRKPSVISGLALLAAACVALLIAVSMLLNRGGEEGLPNNIVAVLIDSEDCVWESADGDKPYSFGSPFQKGEALQVKSGIARLAMNGNAGLALEGPAKVKVVSDQEVRVFYGRVSAYAPEEAIGFKLTTPDVEIVDLGTRFAADVDKGGRTDVHVFEGEISVKGKSEEVNEMIVEGQARRYGGESAQGSDIKNDPTLFADPPALEQLLAIAGSNDAGSSPSSNAGAGGMTEGGNQIVRQDFTNGQGALDGNRGGWGFGKNPWMASRAFTRIIPTVASHSGREKAGGYLLVRGRNNAEPTVANRLRRQLDEVLPNDYYFAIRARYKGLDGDDFFSLWIDVHGREDATHADVPTLGIREGRYFARLHREHSAIAGSPSDGEEFVIAGHYVWDEKLAKARIALWVNPSVSGDEMPEPDASSLGPEREEGAPELQFIGLRMGNYTEVSDELLVYGISVAGNLSAVVEAVREEK